ncbi:MAG: queuosine precursor transporter [Holosporaceae bacterium]|jgi:uncharacterized integral membrane protein (TIGR00697 family)|nr:queuosine precursor transporter [Holosporaceae bacterium]
MIPEILSLATLVICFLSILGVVRFFGPGGLYAYTCVAVIASNIQVLKLTKYACTENPVALGTVVFSSVFAVDNILNEYYGEKTAKTNLYLSFCCYLLFAVIMEIAVLHPPIEAGECHNFHAELRNLFSPCLVLFISSIIAYVVSQFADIRTYSALKRIFGEKYISARSIFTMAISTFVDNCVFSTLAWKVLAENPVSISSLCKTYIFATYFIRLIIAVLCGPLVELSGLLVHKTKNV